jgi:putative transcriptional regulator
VVDGVFMGGSFDALKELLNENKIESGEIRFFLGYSGWSNGQLEEELKENSWIIADGKLDFIMNTEHENLWETVLKSMGDQHKIISNFPENPSLN